MNYSFVFTCYNKCTVNVLKFRILYSIIFWPNLLLMQLFLKKLGRMANIEDPDQTAPEGAV